ncbi:MAG: hypothetical protein M1830_008108 [Pleopsidium flavum]|nr:MAG: hypothetical protein M1830_008108 [Pleopsidium flavum]
MAESDQAFHDSQKPSWGPDGTLIYAMASKAGLLRRDKSTLMSGSVLEQRAQLVSEGKDVCFAKFASTSDLTPETLKKQRVWTSIATADGVPHAQMLSTSFTQFSQLVDGKGQQSSLEKLVWELAHILFDDYDDDISTGVPENERPQFQQRIRKDRLTQFWQQLVQDSASKAVAAASTAEERAIAYLSAFNIEDACGALLQGKDFRLATLVAQLGGNKIMREDMGNQINEWRRLNVLSEFTEPIRALYELLAGNTCVCEGKKGSLEDRARAFVISDKFSLDWKRAFGLRLWYAIDADEPIEEAVRKFSQDIESGHEGKKPLPWFIEQALDPLWNDEHAMMRTDLLWGLVKLFADGKRYSGSAIAHTVMPQNVSRNPIDMRLSFQLYHALTSRTIGEGKTDEDNVDKVQADQLAWGFSTQLEAAGEWLWAVFATLHLSSTEQRQEALQSLIAHHAHQIGEADSAPFSTLRDEFKIPEAWIWEAKALYARSVEQDHLKEVDFLLKAKNWNEAHKTLCRIVAPRAIVEQDYQILSSLLDGFESKDLVEEWSLGGQVFQDFIALTQGRGENGLKRLLAALPAMVKERPGKLGFIEMVAVQEMSGIVARKVLEGKRAGADGAKVLQLPLTEDASLKHTLDLSLQYYKAVMAGGR